MERLFVPLTVAEWHEISIEAIVRGTSRPAELRRRAGLPPLDDGRKANGRRRPRAAVRNEEALAKAGLAGGA